MSTIDPGQGGAPAPGVTTPNDGGAATWYPKEHETLVTSKGWKDAGDVFKSYSELEAFRGRSIAIPEADKIDDAFRADLFKKIGYEPPVVPGAPEKWEDYGVESKPGMPEGFVGAMAQAAQKLGISKEQLAGLVQANNEFLDPLQTQAAEAQERTINERMTAANGALSAEQRELVTRTAVAQGYTPEGLEALELALAGSEDPQALVNFRNTMLINAELRREAPLHRGSSERSAELNPAQAQARLNELGGNPEWRGKALTRGTPEAEENLRLNRIIAGASIDADAIRREAAGLR